MDANDISILNLQILTFPPLNLSMILVALLSNDGIICVNIGGRGGSDSCMLVVGGRVFNLRPHGVSNCSLGIPVFNVL